MNPLPPLLETYEEARLLLEAKGSSIASLRTRASLVSLWPHRPSPARPTTARAARQVRPAIRGRLGDWQTVIYDDFRWRLAQDAVAPATPVGGRGGRPPPSPSELLEIAMLSTATLLSPIELAALVAAVPLPPIAPAAENQRPPAPCSDALHNSK